MVDAPGGLALRRAGYVLAIVFDVVLLVVLNVEPGWESSAFLTADAGDVIGLVNALLLLSLGLNVSYLFSESPLLHGLGDAAIATLCLVVLARLFVLFPFKVPASGFNWELAVRILLGLAMAASFVGVVAGLGRVARTLHVRAHHH